MNTTPCESHQNCSKLKELSEENANLRKEIDNLKRSLMRYENPHTPSSRRMYPSRTGDHNKSKTISRKTQRPQRHNTTQTQSNRHNQRTRKEKHLRPLRRTTPQAVHVGHHVIEEIATPHPRQVIDFLEFKYKCTSCNTYTSTRHPDCPPDGVFGKNALIQTTLMKFEERLPFEKISKQMESQFDLSNDSCFSA